MSKYLQNRFNCEIYTGILLSLKFENEVFELLSYLEEKMQNLSNNCSGDPDSRSLFPASG